MIKTISNLKPGESYDVQFAGVLANGEMTEWTNTYTLVVPGEGMYGYDQTVTDSSGTPTYKTLDVDPITGAVTLRGASINTSGRTPMKVTNRTYAVGESMTLTTEKAHGIVPGDYIQVNDVWDEAVISDAVTIASGLSYLQLQSASSVKYSEGMQVRVESNIPQIEGLWSVFNHGHFKCKPAYYGRTDIQTPANSISSITGGSTATDEMTVKMIATEKHNLLVGSTFTIPASTGTSTVRTGSRTVTEVVDSYTFKYIRGDTGTLPSGSAYLKSNFWSLVFADYVPFETGDSAKAQSDAGGNMLYTDRSSSVSAPASATEGSLTAATNITVTKTSTKGIRFNQTTTSTGTQATRYVSDGEVQVPFSGTDDLSKLMLVSTSDSILTVDTTVPEYDCTVFLSGANGAYRVISVTETSVTVEHLLAPSLGASPATLEFASLEKVQPGVAIDKTGGSPFVALPSGTGEKMEQPGRLAGIQSNGRAKFLIKSAARTSGSTVVTFETVGDHGMATGNYVEVVGTTTANTVAYAPVVVTVTDATHFTCSPNATTTTLASGSVGTVERVIPIKMIRAAANYYENALNWGKGYLPNQQLAETFVPHGLRTGDSIVIATPDPDQSYIYPSITVISPTQFLITGGPLRAVSEVTPTYYASPNRIRVDITASSVGSFTAGDNVYLMGSPTTFTVPDSVVNGVGAGTIDVTIPGAALPYGTFQRIEVCPQVGSQNQTTATVGQIYLVETQRPKIQLASPYTEYERSRASIALEPGTSNLFESLDGTKQQQTGANPYDAASSGADGVAGIGGAISSVSEAGAASTSRIILNAGEGVFTGGYAKSAAVTWNTQEWEAKGGHGVFLTQEMDGWWSLSGIMNRLAAMTNAASGTSPDTGARLGLDSTILTIESSFAIPDKPLYFSVPCGVDTAFAGTEGTIIVIVAVLTDGRVIIRFPKWHIVNSSTNTGLGGLSWGGSNGKAWISLAGVRWKNSSLV